MRCPTLHDLPAPPPGKTGWPWTEESPQLPEQTTDGREWPKISIVTPSYSQGQFLEETLRSVLLQGYPNLEYIVIDGGSKDCSVEVIQKYESFLKFWVSEPDQGQSHALNKGIAKATGQVFTFLNSDDFLSPNTLAIVSYHFINFPNDWVLCGGHKNVDAEALLLREIQQLPTLTWEDLTLSKAYHLQPGTFWRTQAFSVVGRFREDLHYYFDQEFFIRLLQQYPLKTLEGVLACARIHSAAKTQQRDPEQERERYEVILQYLPQVKGNFWDKLKAYRLVKLTYKGKKLTSSNESKFQKILKSIEEPILWTSPTFIKTLFGANFSREL